MSLTKEQLEVMLDEVGVVIDSLSDTISRLDQTIGCNPALRKQLYPEAKALLEKIDLSLAICELLSEDTQNQYEYAMECFPAIKASAELLISNAQHLIQMEK